MNMKSDFSKIVAAIQEKNPVIHHITNFVTAESCADIALAIGASPVMAEAIADVPEFAAAADALVINIGTLRETQETAIYSAVEAARLGNVPVVLDPVGVMSSNYRLAFAVELLKSGVISIIRGNFSECKSLLEEEADGRGVDATEKPDQGTALFTTKELAKKYNCVVALTGEIDFISDGKRAVVLGGGNPLMKRITGAGCMTTTVVASCAAVAEDKMVAAALGIAIMGQSAELAAGLLEKKDGPGMFKVRLIDAAYHVVGKWDLINLDPEKVK